MANHERAFALRVMLYGLFPAAPFYRASAKVEPPMNSFMMELFGMAVSSIGSLRESRTKRREATN